MDKGVDESRLRHVDGEVIIFVADTIKFDAEEVCDWFHEGDFALEGVVEFLLERFFNGGAFGEVYAVINVEADI